MRVCVYPSALASIVVQQRCRIAGGFSWSAWRKQFWLERRELASWQGRR